jgi:hypothetical protein
LRKPPDGMSQREVRSSYSRLWMAPKPFRPRKKPGADAGLKSSVMVGVFEEDDARLGCGG